MHSIKCLGEAERTAKRIFRKPFQPSVNLSRLSTMGCTLSFFPRRKCESSTPPGPEYWQSPSALYLTWLPQLPASSSKPTGISYPTVRDIPSWLLLSPVDIPSAVQANESNMGNQEILPISPPPSPPYLPAHYRPNQRPSSIMAAGERVDPIDEDIVQALSSR